MLAHELKHALYAIKKNVGRVSKTDKRTIPNKVLNDIDNDNQVCDELSRYKCPEVSPSFVTSPFGITFRILIKNIAEIVYFTQQTELESHLETVFNDIKRRLTPENRDLVYDLLRNPEAHGKDVTDISLTLQNYYTLYLRVIIPLYNIVSFRKFKKDYSQIYQGIEEILKKGSHPEFSFYKHVIFWREQFKQFFKKAADIIINIDDLL